MARILIVGCGCRGLALARELRARGHSVRGTTRSAAHARGIADAGAEPFLGDPDRVGTLTPALDGVTVMCLLLASATGTAAHLRALHSTRLEMLLERTIDTTVRGVLYEATGALPADILADGAERVAARCGRSRIPYTLLRAEAGTFYAHALQAIEELLSRA